MASELKSWVKLMNEFQDQVAPVQRCFRQAGTEYAEIGRVFSSHIDRMREEFSCRQAIQKLKGLNGTAAKTLILDSYEDAVGTVEFLVSCFEKLTDEDSLKIREESSKQLTWRNLQPGRCHSHALRDWLANPETPLPLLSFMALSAFVAVAEMPKMGRKSEQYGPCYNPELERLCRAAHKRSKSHTWVRNQVVLKPRDYGFPLNRYADKSKTLDRGIRAALKRLGITLVRKSVPD
jgi:hypothetical protein